MTDPGFEAYLDLLARFLRLSRPQRDDIRRELRAHVEEALDAAQRRGIPREIALRNVLSDFGDAAELAARFRLVQQRRRWIMHTVLTAACVGFLALTGSFLLHSAPAVVSANAPPPGDLVATGVRAPDATTTIAQALRAQDELINAALVGSLADVNLIDMPLKDAIEYFRALLKINVHVPWVELSSAGIAAEHPVNVSVKNLPAARVLRLMLESVSSEPALDYAIEDGVLVISTSEQLARRQTIQIYDVRDLTVQGDDSDGDAGASELAELVAQAVEPETWSQNSGAGNIRAYRGQLVVVQSAPVHARIDRFLAQIRGAVATPAVK